MKRRLATSIRVWLAISMALPGCALQKHSVSFPPVPPDDLDHYRTVATEIEYPDTAVPANPQSVQNLSPNVIGEDGALEYWDLRLEDAMQLALDNSTILRDLGGALLRSPTNARSVQAPGITESDPRYGVEAALSEFDAQFGSRVITEKNNRAVNNVFVGGGTTIIKQDLAQFQTQITKRGVAGTLLTIRHNTDYDANNAPANTFPSAWNTNIEMEARQPLLKDAGVEFNRIAGPNNGTNNGTNSTAGFYNGVLVARINTDISLADFEAGVRDFVSNVENAYWDLYLAYRDLDAKIRARDASLESWRRVHALFTAGRTGGEAEKEAEAREQYFRFQEEVQNSLFGRLIDGTQTFNGSSGGTQRQVAGVRVAERRLRLLLGVAINDGRLIRPADEPKMAQVIFDWDDVLNEAISRRVELRRQRWVVKRRELELIASKNYLLPNLDFIGRYRWRGFGHDLIDPNSQGDGQFANAYADLLGGNFQEWQLGAEFNMPIGFRRGHAAVRNAELQLSRDRALLAEQERSVACDLSNVIAEVGRSYQVTQTSFNRRRAAQQQLESMQAAYEGDQVPFFQVLDAQRRLADSESRFSMAQVEYALAVKNVHFEKGSLLDYNQVYLSEGPWPGKAYHDASRLKSEDRYLNYTMTPGPVSSGAWPQGTLSPGAGEPVVDPATMPETVPAQPVPLAPEAIEAPTPVIPPPTNSPSEPELLPATD